MRLSLAAALLAAAVMPAHAAGITCNLTDQQGNTLQYSFARGGHGYTNEIVVRRNGAIISNGGPMWTRVADKAAKTETLWQGDWSIAYPWNVNASASVLRHGANVVATGICDVDRSIDDNAPVVASAPPPAPAPAYDPPPSYSGRFSVPILNDGKASIIEVNLGGFNQWMLIDTGATGLAVPFNVAYDLVEKGEADRLLDGEVVIADGSTVPTNRIMIHRVSIGGHSIANVEAGVVKDGVTPLLGFPILNQFGKFTIDTQNNLLTFG